MRAVVQRVASARVDVVGEGGDAAATECVGEMGPGLLALIGVADADDATSVDEMARKLVHLRIFEDAEGRMNRSLKDVGGTLGLVSQFTLLADVRKGRRPSFGEAAAPERAAPLFEALVDAVRALDVPVVTGRFQAHMRVALVNDGPVTILLDTERRF